jgi:hypothetical protein
MKTTRMIRHAAHGPWGDAAHHLASDELERGYAQLSPPKDSGELALICARGEDGQRSELQRAALSVRGGLPGDAWFRDCPEKVDAQLTVMRVDVARLFANGQSITLAGDNLFVDLDLSKANLPCGSRLRIGGALLEVTPEPHNGCLKFRQRFGADALRFTAEPNRHDQHLRGIYLKTVEAGEVAVGDTIEVLSRG